MIKAIIFDMDGVISDTQKIHSALESEILNNHGIKITPEEITAKYSGRRAIDFFTELFKEADIDISQEKISKLVHDKRDKMIESLKKNTPPIPGIFELVDRLCNANLKLGIASTSTLPNINVVVDKLNLKDKFTVLTSGHEVKDGKPAPDVFLLAAERLDVLPHECIVIEDGISGMQAAAAAKMKCIGYVPDKDKKYPADILVTHLDEITLELIGVL
jgi:beta-phosphoglucomutase family hydrolase